MRRYSKPEIWSARLSALGTIMSAAGIAWLLADAFAAGSRVHIVTFIVYGVGLLSMFTASAVFHYHAGEERLLWKHIDYAAIALMIAGNFTPFCSLALDTFFAYCVLSVVWVVAIAAITLRIARPDLPKWSFITAYLIMGWLGILIAPALWDVLELKGSFLTLFGGGLYTFGTIVFNRYEGDVEPPGFGFHELWHICILAGAGVHFWVVRLYMLP
ncbi:MAG: hemolysin III family protein [Elusimicrobiota bacterium]